MRILGRKFIVDGDDNDDEVGKNISFKTPTFCCECHLLNEYKLFSNTTFERLVVFML